MYLNLILEEFLVYIEVFIKMYYTYVIDVLCACICISVSINIVITKALKLLHFYFCGLSCLFLSWLEITLKTL